MKRFAVLLTAILLTFCGCASYTQGSDTRNTGIDVSPEVLESIRNSCETTPGKGEETEADKCYWTVNGKCFHLFGDCGTLSRSDDVRSGNRAEAHAAGKHGVCAACAKRAGVNVDAPEFSTTSGSTSEAPVTVKTGELFYWTSGGGCYHAYRDCRSIVKKTDLLIGDIEEACDGNRRALCSYCAKRASDSIESETTTAVTVSVTSAESSGEPSQEIIVFWTSRGEKYHYDRNCHYIKGSSAVLSGSVADAERAGKKSPCSSCGKKH